MDSILNFVWRHEKIIESIRWLEAKPALVEEEQQILQVLKDLEAAIDIYKNS